MAFKMGGWKGYQKPSPKKQTDNYGALPENLQRGEMSMYEGVVAPKDWSDTAEPADETQLQHLRRTNFMYPADTKEGQAERAKHANYIEKMRLDPRLYDLKKDKTKSYLTKHEEKIGITQVQDEFGTWHKISKKGNFVGGSRDMSPESKAWRRQMSFNPEFEPIAANTGKDPVLIHQDPVKEEREGKVTVGKVIDGPKPKKEKSFGEAFKEARGKKQKIFEWKGKKYHSRRADEKKKDWEDLFGAKGTPSPGPEPK
jgi:hypothetical protein